MTSSDHRYYQKVIRCRLCDKTITYRFEKGEEEKETFNICYYCKSCFKKMTTVD